MTFQHYRLSTYSRIRPGRSCNFSRKTLTIRDSKLCDYSKLSTTFICILPLKMPPKNYITAKMVVYQPSAGVKKDFETLLERFTETGTVRYEKFAEIWRSMKMNAYCAGRQNDREVREFIEECFHIASQFWLPPSSFQVRAGALYLLYGLFNFQLCMPRVKIRVTHKMWSDVIEFQAQAREEQHYDLDFIFHKLRLQKAFCFVSEHRELYLATTNFHQGQDLLVPDNFRDETTILEEVFSRDFMEQLSAIHDQYYKMKVALAGPDAATPDRSLDVMENKLIDNITKTMIAFKERRQGRSSRKRKQTEGGSSDQEEDSSDDDEDGDPTYTPGNIINTKRSTIKASAYSGLARASRSRRHRQVVMEEDSSPSKREKKRGTPKENDADELCQESEVVEYSPKKNAKCKPVSEEEEEVEKEKDNTVSLDMPCLTLDDNSKPGSSAEEKSSKLLSKGKKSKRTTGKVLPKMLPNLEYKKKEKKEKKKPGQKKRKT